MLDVSSLAILVVSVFAVTLIDFEVELLVGVGGVFVFSFILLVGLVA